METTKFSIEKVIITNLGIVIKIEHGKAVERR
jgi:hypothetical protein